jgi:hypothetical protein
MVVYRAWDTKERTHKRENTDRFICRQPHDHGNNSVKWNQTCTAIIVLAIYNKSISRYAPNLGYAPVPVIHHSSNLDASNPFTFLQRLASFLFLIPTSNANGFLKNPSLVCISPCLSSNSYLLNTVPTISANSISATFLPTHALGP